MTRSVFAADKSPLIAILCLILAVCQPAVAWAANLAPVISGKPSATATVHKAYGFTPNASDPEGRSLKFTIANKPGWAKFSTSTGRLSGYPRSSHIGTYSNIVISASDGTLKSSLPAFSIKVTATANGAPLINGTPSTTAIASTLYSFSPSASDPDGQVLTFSIANKPGWATFSTSTGKLSGTPTSTHVGTYSSVVISASDGSTSTSLAPFSITVTTGTNRSPVISGTPVKTGAVGQPYSFRPTASDPDGNPLTFSISGKPAWASFDSSNGTVYGTPTAQGTFSNIVISVSDGKLSSSLAAYAVTVTAATTSSVTVSWVPPTKNTDGTPITALAGYRVAYGTVSGQYANTVPVSSPTLTSIVLQGLASGQTWFFAVKAISSGGAESAYTTEVSKFMP